ncbi:MAG: hydrogenase/urease maturation nickel metallochaperone HypA [Anaerolineae bacterium]
MERIKAIVEQAIAEAAQQQRTPAEIHLIVYGGTDDDMVREQVAQAAQGTPAEKAVLVLEHAGSRYICWNCCGLRCESDEGVCPNCGDAAFKIPEEIAVALRRVTT